MSALVFGLSYSPKLDPFGANDGGPSNSGEKKDSAALPYQSDPHPAIARSKAPSRAFSGDCRYFV